MYVSLIRTKSDLGDISIPSEIKSQVTEINNHRVSTRRPKETKMKVDITFKDKLIESDPLPIIDMKVIKFDSLLLIIDITPFSEDFQTITIVCDHMDPNTGVAIYKSAFLVSLLYISFSLIYFFTKSHVGLPKFAIIVCMLYGNPLQYIFLKSNVIACYFPNLCNSCIYAYIILQARNFIKRKQNYFEIIFVFVADILFGCYSTYIWEINDFTFNSFFIYEIIYHILFILYLTLLLLKSYDMKDNNRVKWNFLIIESFSVIITLILSDILCTFKMYVLHLLIPILIFVPVVFIASPTYVYGLIDSPIDIYI